MSNFSINDDQVNQIIKCLVKSKESYLVIARKLQINTKTVKAVGYKNIGPELFEARELEARKVLASKIKQLASQGKSNFEIADALGLSQSTLYRIADQFDFVIDDYRHTAKQSQSEQESPQAEQDFTFIEVTDDETQDKEAQPSLPAPNCAPVPAVKQQSRVPAPYGHRNNYDGYHRNDQYHRGYHQRNYNNTSCRSYNGDNRNRQYHNNHQVYHQGKPPQQQSTNVVRISYNGMEFTFNSGGRNPSEVVLELMQKVNGCKF